VREKMKKLAKTSHGSLSHSNPFKIPKSDHSLQPESQDTPIPEPKNSTEGSTETESNPEYNTEDTDTHQPPLLSGVAKVLEKQKKEDLKRKEREFTASDSDEEETHDKPKKKKKKKVVYDQDHENYDSWAPPEGQTGDGRTYLNEKYGY